MECYLKLKEDEKCHMHIRTLKESDYFGEFSFFSNQSERFSVKCLTFSTLIKIDLQDFLEILKEFPSDYVPLYHYYLPLYIISLGGLCFS